MKYLPGEFEMFSNTQVWAPFLLHKLFDISYGNKFDLCAINEVGENNDNSISFVSRTAKNNGVSAHVERTNACPFPAGSLTVALGGS